MNLQPWIDGDEAGMEAEGYKDGYQCCKEGWCPDGIADGPIDTPWARGFIRGWDDAKAAGLHGTEPYKRDRRLPHWDNAYLPEMVGDNPALKEVSEILKREIIMDDPRPETMTDSLANMKPSLTLAWDFVLAEGDTIKEKFEKLFDVVVGQCYSLEGGVPTVYTDDRLSGVLSVCEDIDPKYQKMSDGTVYVGRYHSNSGGCPGFDLWSLPFPSDDIKIVKEGKLTILKVFNNPL